MFVYDYVVYNTTTNHNGTIAWATNGIKTSPKKKKGKALKSIEIDGEIL